MNLTHDNVKGIISQSRLGQRSLVYDPGYTRSSACWKFPCLVKTPTQQGIIAFVILVSSRIDLKMDAWRRAHSEYYTVSGKNWKTP